MKHPSFTLRASRAFRAGLAPRADTAVICPFPMSSLSQIRPGLTHTGSEIQKDRTIMPAPKVIAKQPAVQSRPTDEKQLLTAGISHELRTPLTILKGRLHGIEDGVIDPDSEETARVARRLRSPVGVNYDGR